MRKIVILVSAIAIVTVITVSGVFKAANQMGGNDANQPKRADDNGHFVAD
jgi:hypothetical protein